MFQNHALKKALRKNAFSHVLKPRPAGRREMPLRHGGSCKRFPWSPPKNGWVCTVSAAVLSDCPEAVSSPAQIIQRFFPFPAAVPPPCSRCRRAGAAPHARKCRASRKHSGAQMQRIPRGHLRTAQRVARTRTNATYPPGACPCQHTAAHPVHENAAHPESTAAHRRRAQSAQRGQRLTAKPFALRQAARPSVPFPVCFVISSPFLPLNCRFLPAPRPAPDTAPRPASGYAPSLPDNLRSAVSFLPYCWR